MKKLIFSFNVKSAREGVPSLLQFFLQIKLKIKLTTLNEWLFF